MSTSMVDAHQGFLRVVRAYRLNLICQLYTALSAANKADVTQISTLVGLKRSDFRLVVRRYHPEPVQPELPAIGHGILQFHVQDACAFPVPAKPGRRMEAPKILGPPLAKMIRNRPLDFPHQPGSGDAHRAARLQESREIIQI